MSDLRCPLARPNCDTSRDRENGAAFGESAARTLVGGSDVDIIAGLIPTAKIAKLLKAASTAYRSRKAAKEGPTIKSGSAGGPTAGQRFPESVRQAEKATDPTSTCVFCGMPGRGTQVDHAIPRARGGNATRDNAQLACLHCNASKGARDYPVNPPPGYEGPWPPRHWPRGGD